MTIKTVTLQTHFDDKTTLAAFAKIFNVSTTDFENEEGNIYLNERFPLEKSNKCRLCFH